MPANPGIFEAWTKASGDAENLNNDFVRRPNKPFKKDENGIQAGPDYIRILLVFITNQCNLACTNCCAPTFTSKSKSQYLKWPDFRNAIDTFMDPKQVPYFGQKTISIQGGESFLAYPTLLKCAQYVQRFEDRPNVYIHTNGTVLKPDWVKSLQDLDIDILFSLDGDKEGNDHFRIYPDSKIERSVWDKVMENIDKIPDKKGLGVNMTLRPHSLQGTLKAMDGFAGMGLKFMNLETDCYHYWTPQDLAALKRFWDDLHDYYVKKTEETGDCPFHLGMVHDGIERQAYLNRGEHWWRSCCQLILGSDGNFYDCESSQFFDYDNKKDFNWEEIGDQYSCNHASAGQGVDWAKRQRYMDAADARLGELSPDSEWQQICPRLYYSMEKTDQLAEESGKPSIIKDGMIMAANMSLVSKVYRDGIVKIAMSLRNHPSFKELYITNRSTQGS